MLEKIQSHRDIFGTLKQVLFSSSLINEKRKSIISRLITIPKNNNSRLISLSLYFSSCQKKKKMNSTYHELPCPFL